MKVVTIVLPQSTNYEKVAPDVLMYDSRSLMLCTAQSFRNPFFTVCGHVASFDYVDIISTTA